MREYLSLRMVRTLAAIAAAIGAICSTIAIVVLVLTVNGQQGRLAHQSLELECRGEVTANIDVIRSNITLHLSRGLRFLVTEDEAALRREVAILGQLDDDLAEASQERADTIEICADGER